MRVDLGNIDVASDQLQESKNDKYQNKERVHVAHLLEKQRRLAETLRLRADAEGRGKDVERQKNWELVIEENEEWEKKLARKARRADFEFIMVRVALSLSGLSSFHVHNIPDDSHSALRKYKRDVDKLKPGLETYNKQKGAAMGLGAFTKWIDILIDYL